ncbi:unnamed protein product [Brachionus calyciflorus]|uniref:Uncharacterized protein n=1 Tax=Brachionus calyciflorus TaxID=104777 RepID=A0A813QG96_9BILA|nr:unnamed protein product [Brachionus calyciflorus]
MISDESEETDNFNYVGSLVNYEPLVAMSNFKKQEEERRIQLLNQYKSEITPDDITNEVRQIWRRNNSSDKRKRITEKDRREALSCLHRKIKERVQVQLAIEFKENFGEKQSY